MYTVEDMEEAHRIHFLLKYDPNADRDDVLQAMLNANYIVGELIKQGTIKLEQVQE